MAFEIAFETAARVSVPPERALKAHEGPRSQVEEASEPVGKGRKYKVRHVVVP